MRNRSNEQDFLCQMLDVINWVEAVLCFLSSKRQSSLDLTIFSLYQRINFLFIKTPCWRQIVHKMSNLCHESRGITQLWASSWNYTKSNILPWVFFTFLNFTNDCKSRKYPFIAKKYPLQYLFYAKRTHSTCWTDYWFFWRFWWWLSIYQ